MARTRINPVLKGGSYTRTGTVRQSYDPSTTGIGRVHMLDINYGRAVITVTVNSNGPIVATFYGDPGCMVGKGIGSHVNAYLEGLGLKTQQAQYRRESDGPVLKVSSTATGKPAHTVFLNRFINYDPSTQRLAQAHFALTRTATGEWESAVITDPSTLHAPGANRQGRPAVRNAGRVISTKTAPTAAPSVGPAVSRTGKRLVAPAGFVVLPDRQGNDLVIPERTVHTFSAALSVHRSGAHTSHPLAIGPTGAGKTEGVVALAIANGLRCPAENVIQCGGFVEVSDLYGQTQPDETAPHGWRRFPSALWGALITARDDPDHGYALILDEVNRMSSLAAQNALFGLLDGSSTLSNPATGESLALPANLFVVATANIGAAYGGTLKMDAALMSRWFPNIVFTYLPEPVEATVCESIGLSTEDARLLARAAAEVRTADATESFRSALAPGTRTVVNVARQALFDPKGVAGAWHDGVVCSFSAEGRDPARTEYAKVRVISESVFAGRQP